MLQSSPANEHTDGTIESVHINGVSVLSGSHFKNKVEAVSYNQAFRWNFQFVNLKESSSKIQGARIL